MPRKARLDAPGALHHIIFRGIERRIIFPGDEDRDDFLERLGSTLKRTQTACYAWALIPNHVHLLLRTGETPISQVMRCLLTGYAVGFNLRHRRHGHLFQNRYKSILCQEDSYLLELVRYIHLNPLRAKLVTSVAGLDDYPYCGHSAVLNRHPREWQGVDRVLSLFGGRVSRSREMYRDFIAKGVETGRRPELTGGGLVRSLGGWDEVKRRRKTGDWGKSDERILGDPDFVLAVLAAGQERLARTYSYRSDGWDFDRLVMRVSEVLNIDSVRVTQKGRYPDVVRARSLLCYWAHRELGLSTVELARRLGLTQPAISQSVARGRAIVVSEGLVLASIKIGTRQCLK
jgi:putative transposase